MSEGLLSGVLPAIYSGSNTFKRKLVDALRNPGATLENMAGNAYDKTMRAGQMLADATAESDKALRSGANPFKGPASDRLTQAVMENYNPAGITVWHGSPHGPFTKFNASKIGSGEGGARFGHGHYVAEAQATGEQYRDMLKYKAAPDAKGGFLYKIDLPDEHVDRMLDWDKPVAVQPIANTLRPAVEKITDGPPSEKFGLTVEIGGVREFIDAFRTKREAQAKLDNLIGGDLIRGLSPSMGVNVGRRLNELGTPGIRYLDQGSRAAGTGTSNFVVFPGNEDMLKILEVNGQPLIEALRKKK